MSRDKSVFHLRCDLKTARNRLAEALAFCDKLKAENERLKAEIAWRNGVKPELGKQIEVATARGAHLGIFSVTALGWAYRIDSRRLSTEIDVSNGYYWRYWRKP